MHLNLSNFLTVSGTAISSFFIASCIVVKYVWMPWMNQIKDEHKKEELEYEYLHMQEYDMVEVDQPVDDERLNELKSSYVEEVTPKGKVTMFYNKDVEAFWYYSDTKDIPYKYLDTIARVYCLKFNCKSLYINTFEEYKKGIEEAKKKKEIDEKKKEEGKNEEVEKPIFATFKHYNKGKGGELKTKKNKYAILRKSANRYTYKGILESFDEYLNENKKTNSDEDISKQTMTFEEFKRLQELNTLEKKNN